MLISREPLNAWSDQFSFTFYDITESFDHSEKILANKHLHSAWT